MPITRLRATLLVPALAAVSLTLSACSSDSSSGPKPFTAAQLAAHYDSLSTALGNDTAQNSNSMGVDISFFNGVIADGILPSTVTVTVGGQTQTWFGNFANLIFNSGQDSLQVGFLWKDTQVDAFAGFVLVNATMLSGDAGIAALGGDFLSDSSWSWTGSFAQGSGSCQYATITNIPVFMGIASTYGNTSGITSCTPATATVSGTLNSEPGDTTASAALQALSFTSQSITGARLVTSASVGQQVVHALQAKGLAHGGSVFFRRR